METVECRNFPEMGQKLNGDMVTEEDLSEWDRVSRTACP